MTENEQKQQLSFAYIHALAARAGYTFQQTPVDDDSIDVRIGARGFIHGRAVVRSPIMEFQLKATQRGEFVRENHVAFPLPVKNFNELRLNSMLPRLLVVFLLPADPGLWLETSEECMISRHCAYWVSLRGMVETDNTSTVTVSLPFSQRLTVEGLRELMERGRAGRTVMMTNNGLKIPKEQLAAMRPGDVQSYLLSRGWLADREASPPRGTLFRHPSIPDAEALLPLDRDLGDYVFRMADIVLVVAAVENRSVWQVLNDLSGPPSDVLRLRVVASDATLGNLPLEEGIKLLRGGRDLLWAAAHGTLRPQALHPQHDLRPVQEFLSECRLGQTERGSFVATILAPVPPQVQSLLNLQYEEGGEGSEPFARRVTTRLMSSLDFVRQSILTGEEKRILDGVARGVSANFCDALVMMKPPGYQSQLDIRMNWARSRPLPGENIPQSVSFAKESFQAIEEVGRQLRRRATVQAERLTGKVVELRTAFRSLLDDVAGRIVLETEVRGESARVKVDLGEDDYRRACDAHRDGHRVAVTGIIHYEARAKHFELSDPQAFEVLKES